MSIIHVNQIKNRLKSLFTGKVDLSDVNATGPDLENQFLTRALAAYAVHFLAKTDADAAAKAVVDGADDNGIDAVYLDESENRLYIVQSKWIHDGKGEPELGDVKKFTGGVRDLFNMAWDRFSPKVQAKRNLVEKALTDSTYTYVVALAYTGINGLALHASRDLTDLADEMNDASEVLSLKPLNQAALHASLASSLSGAPINLDITLYAWGKMDTPHKAFYGQVSGAEIEHWWATHGTRLFAKNLRSILGDTEVNEEIKKTVTTAPEYFWYFNNGITIVADNVTKTMAGGGDRDFGTFQCSGISIVNGAQTVGTLGRVATRLSVTLDTIRVPIRIISLEGCPATFGAQVTRANNRQNRIDNRDFVSQDPVQLALQRDLAIDGIEYNLMRSDSFAASDKSFDLIESTTALACASGKTALVVQLKREIGKLWEDPDRAPYKELFNPTVSSAYVWHCVQVQRIIDRTLGEITRSLGAAGGRPYGIAIHGNRIIASLVFSRIEKAKLGAPSIDSANQQDEQQCAQLTQQAQIALVTAAESLFPNAILPTLFKNATKCVQLYAAASTACTVLNSL